jgi:hypothetical protein
MVVADDAATDLYHDDTQPPNMNFRRVSEEEGEAASPILGALSHTIV